MFLTVFLLAGAIIMTFEYVWLFAVSDRKQNPIARRQAYYNEFVEVCARKSGLKVRQWRRLTLREQVRLARSWDDPWPIRRGPNPRLQQLTDYDTGETYAV